MSDYELYTYRGNILAARLVGAVADGVASGSLTRARALEAACEAVSDIASVDPGMSDSEPFRAIAAELSAALFKAGMDGIDGNGLREAHWRWSREGGGNRPADGNRHFGDASWFDPERLAFHDACEALDAVKGHMNTINYHARMPEASGYPHAAFADGAASSGVVSVSVGDDGRLSVSVPPGAADGPAKAEIRALADSVEAANAAVSRLGGRLEPTLRVFDRSRGPQFGVLYQQRVIEVERAAFPGYDGPTLGDMRRVALEKVASGFDFGAPVEDMSGWRRDESGTEYTCRVFVQDAEDPESDSVRGTLTVRFEPWSAEVAEVRARLGGVEVPQSAARGLSASRLVVSGRVADADALRWLVRAVAHDAARSGDAGLPGDAEAALDAISRTEGGGLVLASDASSFEGTRRVCEQLGLSYVHETDGPDGAAWTCFDERSRPSSAPLFGFRGTVGDPLVPFAMLDDPGAEDAEMGALVRRDVARRVEAARRISRAALDVEASIVDELRNSQEPERGRGLL